MESIKEVYETCEDFECVLEEAEGFMFVHLEVYQWSVSTYKKMKPVFFDILKMAKERGFEFLFFYYEDPKVFKFANKFKSTVDPQPITLEDGSRTYYLGVWEL